MDAKEQLQAYARDLNKAREIAAKFPGTEVTVNGVYAHVPVERKPSFFASLFGSLFDPPPR